MNISSELVKQPWFKSLRLRANNFKAMIEHIQDTPNANIIETGTAWDKGNWEGQGQSTLIWDWAAGLKTDLTVRSIDIRQEGVDVAKAQTNHVMYLCGDSIKTLAGLAGAENINLLYLDSYDWTPQLNVESAAHHLMELTSVWARLPSGCMVVVDDRHGNFQGKHWMVEAYMTKLDIKPAFKNHQMGWIKP